MKFTTFIENRYQELRLEQDLQSKRQEYSLANSSETLALMSVLNFARTVAKWAMVPKVLLDYFLVTTGLLKAPTPVLTEMLKKQIAEQEEATTNVTSFTLGVTPPSPPRSLKPEV